jgi:hypothetical protein
MNTLIQEPALIIETALLEEIDIPILVDVSGELISEPLIPAKRFGIVDLWNIRKNGRRFNW